MDIRTRIRGLLVRAGLLIAAIAAVTVAINLSWFDEPLHPELQRLKTPQPVSMEDNAYPLVYGFPAADDRDPRAAGLAIVETLRERYREGRRMAVSDEELSRILGGSGFDDAWRASFSSLPCNSRFALDCAEQLIADLEHADPNQPRLRVLLDRYGTILHAARFEENQEFDAYTPVPAYGTLLPVGRIRLAMSYEHEPTQVFLARVAEDVAFWKMTLRDGQTLIAKMVALAALRNDLTFLSALMRDRDLSEEDLEFLRQYLSPFTSEERDIGETFLAELRIALLSEKSLVIPEEGSWTTRLLLQQHATLNEYYFSTILPMQLRASLSPAEFYRQRGYEQLSYSVRAFPPPLFNLGGKLVLEHIMTENNLQDYITRVHDLEGRILLVLLQAELESRSERSVPEVVRTSTYKNPYTGEPMDYDEAAQTIRFDCLEASSSDVCAVVLSSLGG